MINNAPLEYTPSDHKTVLKLILCSVFFTDPPGEECVENLGAQPILETGLPKVTIPPILETGNRNSLLIIMLRCNGYVHSQTNASTFSQSCIIPMLLNTNDLFSQLL